VTSCDRTMVRVQCTYHGTYRTRVRTYVRTTVRPLVFPLHLSACISSRFWDNVIFVHAYWIPVLPLVRTYMCTYTLFQSESCDITYVPLVHVYYRKLWHNIISTYVRTIMVRTSSGTYHFWYVLIMLCHNFLRTMVPWYVPWYQIRTMVPWYVPMVRPYVRGTYHGTYVHVYVLIMLCHNFLIAHIHVHWEPRAFWEDTRTRVPPQL
jgi:hypothetical protein